MGRSDRIRPCPDGVAGVAAPPQPPARHRRAARAGLISRAEIARRTGLCRSTGLEPGRRSAGRRPRGRARRARRRARRPGRPPADPALLRRLGRRGARHRLRPPPPARRGLRPVSNILAERARRARHRPRARTRASTRPPSSSAEVLAEAGRRALARDRRGHGPARPDRAARRRRRLHRDPPRLGRRRRGGGDARAASTLPIIVDNDANLGALAEAALRRGARTRRDLVYLKVSSGIGAGLILNGRLYRGAAGLAGELGHVLVDPEGPVCRCGNRGCLETVAVDRRAARAAAPQPRRRPRRSPTMVRLAREGDLGCRRVIADAGRAIGSARRDAAQRTQPASC